jgi:hypothetical protein
MKQIKPGDYCLIRPERVRPTQVFVGKVEMECTKSEIQTKSGDDLKALVMDNFVPAVIGPGAEFYITDHHHFAVAMFQAFLDFKRPALHRVLYACIQADYSSYNASTFWRQMMNQKFVFLEDEYGNNITAESLPITLKLMADNPYRTFASWLRQSNAFIKCGGKKTSHLEQCKNQPAPFFIECYWGDFIRKTYPLTNYPAWPDVIPPLDDFIYRASLQLQAEALYSIYNDSLHLALSNAASGLPGYNVQRDKMPIVKIALDGHGCVV